VSRSEPPGAGRDGSPAVAGSPPSIITGLPRWGGVGRTSSYDTGGPEEVRGKIGRRGGEPGA
ncbi:MAG TPA: hypothetical protein VMS17_29710, partial [Gemmataceae bacterium]|nr:hypothetical protein [Gemmataceae bacterium]